jgi:hypothetical protein
MIAVPLAGLILLGAGCNEPTYIVYVHNDPCSIRSWDDDIIDELRIFPKDRVVFINATSTQLTIKFGDGTPNTVFDETEVVIEPNKRAMLSVKSDATGSLTYVISPCDSSMPGSPKVVVGDPP